MIVLILSFCCCLLPVAPSEQDEHRDFQYKSVVDGQSGFYNFAYDTGNDNTNEIAHSMRMEHKDADGIVRGRYGYTDPRGKLRVVEYEAGPDGFKARGDVGPDSSEHSEMPGSTSPVAAVLDGWDPSQIPVGDPAPVAYYPFPQEYLELVNLESELANPKNENPISKSEIYEAKNLKISSTNADSQKSDKTANTGTKTREPIKLKEQSQPLTIHNIDVPADDIRVASKVTRSAKDIQSESSSIEIVEPVSDQKAEASGVVVTRKIPSSWTPVAEIRYPHRDSHGHVAEKGHDHRETHDHASEKKHDHRETHDHAAEIRSSKNTHDHASEIKSLRLTHDHASEGKHQHGYSHDHHNHSAEVRYPNRATHDHDAEVKYSTKHDHDHSAELKNVKGTSARYVEYYAPRIVYYRDDHNPNPHRHSEPLRVYRNDRDHRHSDVHLYGDTGKSYTYYPGTVRPHHLRYIPADRYHDKYYYWT